MHVNKLLCCFSVVAWMSCNGPVEQRSTEAILCGTIVQPMTDRVLVDWQDTTYVALVDSNGFFRLRLPVAFENFASLEHGDETAELFLKQGDSLYITFKTDSFDETLKFEGIGASANHYLIASFLQEERMDIYPNNFLLDETGFLRFEDSVHVFRLQLIDSFALQWSDPSFDQLMRRRAQVKHLQRKLDYPLYYRYLTGDKLYKPSEGYYSFIKSAPLDDTVYFRQYIYKHFLESIRNVCMASALPSTGGSSDVYMQRALHVIDSAFKEPVICAYLLQNSFTTYFETEGPNAKAYWLDTVQRVLSDTAVFQELQKIYREWLALSPGKPAPTFSFSSSIGAVVSLESLRGRWVYVDVWATWCGPCLKELPDLERLQKTFQSKPIAFVSISIDEDSTAWATMVRVKEMRGIQLIADKAFQSDICKQYRITSIPRFILIDPKGNLIDADSKRPSGAIEAQLQSLLAKGV